jgi:hypothetical protein
MCSAAMVLFTTTVFICEFRLLRTSEFTHNLFFSNNECPVCEAKLAADNEQQQQHIQFRPKDYLGEDSLKVQLVVINQALQDLKNLMIQQKEEQVKMSLTIE